jgi:broad specificity phosphatase PhoE
MAGTSRKLILIKHARPETRDDVPSHQWRLSEAGRASCAALVEKLHAYAPGVIVTSNEPKARETGQLVAGTLGVSCETAAGLEEHDRSNVPFMRSADFISSMVNFFRERDRLVLGRETAAEAERRIVAAIDELLEAHPVGNLAVVTHGTVLALFAAARLGLDPFANWRAMGLPSFLVVQMPGFRVEEVVERL